MRISDWSSDVCSSDLVWQALSPKYPGLSVCTSITTPAELLQRVGSYKALAAYRMHATVSAMALDVPVVGFEWDPKVLQLFTYCGKREACIDRKSTRLNSSHSCASRMPSSA